VRGLTNRARELAVSVLRANRAALDTGAKRLLETETLLEGDIPDVVPPSMDPTKPEAAGSPP
jgi:ATP-dependent Zn protease